MNICLISPPAPFLEFVGFPPLSLLYLSSYLKLHGYPDTQIIDLNVTEDIPQADVYAISATTPQFPYAEELARRLSGIKIVGGAHPTAIPSDCGLFDKIIIGDGEKALIQCIEDIKNGNNKQIYVGEQVAILDDLPMPDRSSIDISSYNYYIEGELSTLAMTSRGCPYNCYFCMKVCKNVRFHSSEYVARELQDMMNCGYTGVYFMDDIFTLRKDMLSLTPQLKKMAWQCQIRPDENIKNIQLLGKMKCRRASIGLESGSQEILNIVNKRLNLKNVTKIVKECKNNDIKVHPYIIVGLPSETHETIKITIEFLRAIEPDSVGVGVFVPYPGTYIYDHKEEFDIQIKEVDYKKWHFRGGKGGYQCVVSTSGLTADEILRYRDEIDREFNGND